MHYFLDVDSEPVRAVIERVRRVVATLEERTRPTARTPGDIGDTWTGRPARRVKEEMSALADQFVQARRHLEVGLDALNDLAQAYDAAQEEVVHVNEVRRRVVDDHTERLAEIRRTRQEDLDEAERSGVPDPERIEAIERRARWRTRHAEEELARHERNLDDQFTDVRRTARRATRLCARHLQESMLLQPSLLKRELVTANVGGEGTYVPWRLLARRQLDGLALATRHREKAIDDDLAQHRVPQGEW